MPDKNTGQRKQQSKESKISSERKQPIFISEYAGWMVCNVLFNGCSHKHRCVIIQNIFRVDYRLLSVSFIFAWVHRSRNIWLQTFHIFQKKRKKSVGFQIPVGLWEQTFESCVNALLLWSHLSLASHWNKTFWLSRPQCPQSILLWPEMYLLLTPCSPAHDFCLTYPATTWCVEGNMQYYIVSVCL